jgi:predicted dithiol-disulfide oxidoreductase (DUF899 family)
MTSSGKESPKVVVEHEWRTAHQALLTKEKALTHASDDLAAQRRRLPMVRVPKEYSFDGTDGPVALLDLFDRRPQLLLYHFMFAPGVLGWPTAGCPGCSMFIDNIGQFTRIHLNARGASLAVVSRAPLPALESYQRRMQWSMRWVSSAGNSFNEDFGVTTEQGEQHGLSVFLRRDDDIFRTYFTTARGLETVGGIWSLLDLTPFGRQEQWEDSPPGSPQSPPYQWWRRHDEYGVPSY